MKELFCSYLRRCAICRRISGPIDFLCHKCWSRLQRFKAQEPSLKIPKRSFTTLTLFSWSLCEKDFLKKTLKSLSQGHLDRAFSSLSLNMLIHFQSYLQDSKKVPVFIPSSTNAPLCHQLAFYLSLHTNGKLLVLPKKGKKQKKLRLKKHQKTVNFLHSLPTQNHRERWIFIESYPNSPSEAVQIFHKLKKPAFFQAWALFQKPLFDKKALLC